MDPPHINRSPHLGRSFVCLQQLPLLFNLGLVGEDARRVVGDDQLPGDSLKLEDCSAVCVERECMESRSAVASPGARNGPWSLPPCFANFASAGRSQNLLGS